MSARLANAPIGMISLLGATEEELIGRYGVPEWFVPGRRGASRHALCACVVRVDEVLAIEDLLADEVATDGLLRNNPLIIDGGIRSFAGAPLRDEAGQPLGAVSVAGTVARSWSPGDLAEVAEMLRFGTNGEEAHVMSTDRPWPPSMGAGMQVHPRFVAALLDSMQVGVVVADSTGQPIFFNRAARNLSGLPAEMSPVEAMEAVTRQLRHADGSPFEEHELTHVRVLSDETTQRTRSIRSGPEESDWHSILHEPDVSDLQSLAPGPGILDRHIIAAAKAIRTDDGEVLGSVATILDVTARWRADRFRECKLQVATLLSHAESLEEAGPELVNALGEALGWPYVALWLTNHGIGIPPDDRDQLFDRFYRGSNARHNIPGTGLGLTLVRTLVQAHGGTVALDPSQEDGTRILVRLPLDRNGPPGGGRAPGALRGVLPATKPRIHMR